MVQDEVLKTSSDIKSEIQKSLIPLACESPDPISNIECGSLYLDTTPDSVMGFQKTIKKKFNKRKTKTYQRNANEKKITLPE